MFQYTHNDEDIEWDSKSVGDPGEPLFLTPYIEEGKISEGRHKFTGRGRFRASFMEISLNVLS